MFTVVRSTCLSIVYACSCFQIPYKAKSTIADIMPSPVKKFKQDTDVADDNVLSFAKLTEHAFAPVKGSDQAAGLDLKRLVQTIFRPNKNIVGGWTSGYEIDPSRRTIRFLRVVVWVNEIRAFLGRELRRGFFLFCVNDFFLIVFFFSVYAALTLMSSKPTAKNWSKPTFRYACRPAPTVASPLVPVSLGKTSSMWAVCVQYNISVCLHGRIVIITRKKDCCINYIN